MFTVCKLELKQKTKQQKTNIVDEHVHEHVHEHDIVRSICLLIRQPSYKCVAESNKLLGLHDLLNSASHDINYGNDLVNSAT